MVGASCATVTPADHETCCTTKAEEKTADAWCEENYPTSNVSASACPNGAHQSLLRQSPLGAVPAAASHTAVSPTTQLHTSCVLSIPGACLPLLAHACRMR